MASMACLGSNILFGNLDIITYLQVKASIMASMACLGSNIIFGNLDIITYLQVKASITASKTCLGSNVIFGNLDIITYLQVKASIMASMTCLGSNIIFGFQPSCSFWCAFNAWNDEKPKNILCIPESFNTYLHSNPNSDNK